MSTKNFHGRLSLRYRGAQRCVICKRKKSKTKKIGKEFYCEECWRKNVR